MKRCAFPLMLLVLWGLAIHAASAEPAGERVRLFSDGWKFLKGDAPGAEAAAFDDVSWRGVDLPHDFSIEGAFSQQWASGTGFLPAGIGWYRKSFELPAADKARCVRIMFDGVYKNSQVWCNGHLLGRRPYGYSSFHYDLTPYVEFGGHNVIAVRVDHHDFADSRWYPGSGIYRDVHLIVTDRIHLKTWGTFVTTPKVDAREAEIAVKVALANETREAAEVDVVCVLSAAKGKDPLSERVTRRTVAAAGEATITQTLRLDKPGLWSPQSPTLYDLSVRLFRGGKLIDEEHTAVGLRTFRFDPAKGFFLNGEGMKFKGVCIHHDAGALGAAVPLAVWERRLALLKQMGCNAIRMSHNPPAPELLDLCDGMGFLVMDEAFDEWTGAKHKWVAGRNHGTPSMDGYNRDFNEWADADTRDMVLRDRNHPSIIMWSIGNEIDYPNDPFPRNAPELAPIAKRLVAVVKQVDTTRPVTAACAAMPSNLFWPALDIVGYNYQEQLYAADHAKDPKRVIYGSENGRRLNQWLAVADNAFISGQFLWTGIDFLGEANAWPNRGSGAGLLDLAGFPKPAYYFRQSLWAEKPMVYLTPMGDSVMCYTNCERVALYRGGKLLGERAPEASSRTIYWPYELTTATLRAVGKRGDQAVCEFEVKAAGRPAKLALKLDRNDIMGAEDRDVIHAEVEVTDAAGTRVPEASDRVSCTLEGPGKILGIENGNQGDTEPYGTQSRKVFGGRMMVYVGARRGGGAKPGEKAPELILNVSAPGLAPASARIRIQ